MSTPSLGEAVARYVGPIQRAGQVLFETKTTDEARHDAYQRLLVLTAELDDLAQRRIDASTYEYYRRARSEGTLAPIPLQSSGSR